MRNCADSEILTADGGAGGGVIGGHEAGVLAADLGRDVGAVRGLLGPGNDDAVEAESRGSLGAVAATSLKRKRSYLREE